MNEDLQQSSPELAPENHEIDHRHFPNFVPVLVIALVFAAAGIGLFINVDKSDTTQSVTPQVAGQATEEPISKAQFITVEGSNYSFAPAVIHAKKGMPVKVNFINTKGMHDFVIDEFLVKSATLSEGGATVVEFTPDKTGSFEFYSSVGQHRKMGMKGTLIVE